MYQYNINIDSSMCSIYSTLYGTITAIRHINLSVNVVISLISIEKRCECAPLQGLSLLTVPSSGQLLNWRERISSLWLLSLQNAGLGKTIATFKKWLWPFIKQWVDMGRTSDIAPWHYALLRKKNALKAPRDGNNSPGRADLKRICGCEESTRWSNQALFCI